VAEGFLLVDKDRGWTSHDVVAKARGILGERRIGHAGTLDPMATGLLVLGVGRATRLLRFVQEQPKVYEATAMFGVSTDTLDADGAVLWREEMEVDEDDVIAVLPRFTGPILQVPPMVSALKVDGRRLYELAREGVEVEREARPVEIFELEVTEFAPGPYPEVSFRIRCSSGTYIRTLADDIASALGGRAHLTELRRTAIGSLQVGAASTINRLVEAGPAAGDRVVAMAEGMRDLRQVTATEEVAVAVGHGSVFAPAGLGITEAGSYAVVDDAGTLLAVYESDGRRAKPAVVLA
jgi:tRNA pseudouridine55 synthase